MGPRAPGEPQGSCFLLGPGCHHVSGPRGAAVTAEPCSMAEYSSSEEPGQRNALHSGCWIQQKAARSLSFGCEVETVWCLPREEACVEVVWLPSCLSLGC